ncbi:MAG: DUF1351 domain-containing protein [Phocaeicola sp.]
MELLQEKQLELVISEKTLGSLTTNAKQIRDMVKASLPNYSIENYSDDNIDKAKKDKAALNKAAKVLNAKRLEIEKEFVKPFAEFKEIVADTVKLIGECSSKIDIVVKQNEQIFKEARKSELRIAFDSMNINLIDFNKVFKETWTNKSVSLKKAIVELEVAVSTINNDIEAIDSMEDADVLRTYYAETLNLTATIQYGNRLKEQRERARLAEEKQKEAEAKRAYSPSQPAQVMEPVKQAPPQKEELYVRAFKVSTTRENIIALGDFMNERGIDFEKIELDESKL